MSIIVNKTSFREKDLSLWVEESHQVKSAWGGPKNSFLWRSQSCDFAKLCASAFHFLPSEPLISRESLTSVPQFLHSRLLGFGDWSSEWRSKSLQGSPLFTSLQVSFYRKSCNFSKLFIYFFIFFHSGTNIQSWAAQWEVTFKEC